MNESITADPWAALRRFTPARIAQGRCGASLPTRALLELALAQARARDAVHESSQEQALQLQLQGMGLAALAVRSTAADRAQFLRYPDRGRLLDEASRTLLRACAPPGGFDIAFVAADGLSPIAALRHAPALLQLLRAPLAALRWAPIITAQQARVALGDDIGQCLGARQVVMLIGERPGLSAPDSLGIYFTHAPQRGRTDAQRNCISNVRPQGLDYALAAHRLLHLLDAAQRLGRSGVDLKDHSDFPAVPISRDALVPTVTAGDIGR